MLARVRDRLSYANVVATIALFVALGGSSYAALSITSKDVKNRSLKGGDLKKNTVTGTEINESKLGRVPAAREATNAATADVSKSSGTATTAGSATTAALADTAKDAQSLAGQGVGAFEKSSRVQFGRAPGAPAGEPNEQVVLSWPEMGVQVTSSSGACMAGQLQFAVKNTKASGPDVLILDGPGGTVPANSRLPRCGNNNQYEGELTDSTGRALFVDCFLGNNEIRCLGIRSEP